MSSKSSPERLLKNLSFLSNDFEWLLTLYLYQSQKAIHPRVRQLVTNKVNITVSNFIKSYQDLFNHKERMGNFNKDKFDRITNIYESLVSIVDALSDNKRSLKNFNIRCRLLSNISPLTANQLSIYLIDSPDNFLLFRCLDLLFADFIKLNPLYREIFYNRSHFYEDYPLISCRKIYTDLGIKKSTEKCREQALYFKITSIIKQFVIFTPYYYYRHLINTKSDVIRISPELCNRIKACELLHTITPSFVGEVFSVIYNYIHFQKKYKGQVYSYLIKPEHAKFYIPLLKKLVPEIELRRDCPEFEDLGKVLMELCYNQNNKGKFN